MRLTPELCKPSPEILDGTRARCTHCCLKQDKNFIALKDKIPAVRVITDDKLRELGFIPILQKEATEIDGVEEGS